MAIRKRSEARYQGSRVKEEKRKYINTTVGHTKCGDRKKTASSCLISTSNGVRSAPTPLMMPAYIADYGVWIIKNRRRSWIHNTSGGSPPIIGMKIRRWRWLTGLPLLRKIAFITAQPGCTIRWGGVGYRATKKIPITRWLMWTQWKFAWMKSEDNTTYSQYLPT